jgi:hypothetical protein
MFVSSQPCRENTEVSLMQLQLQTVCNAGYLLLSLCIYLIKISNVFKFFC